MTPIKEKEGLVAETQKRFGLFFFLLSVSRFCFDLLSIRLRPLFGPFVVARPARGQPGSYK